MNLPTLPKTNLLVLDTLCPCRRPEDTCCWEVPVTGTADDECCSCHLLTQSGASNATPACKWPFHKIIDGHQAWEMQAITVLRAAPDPVDLTQKEIVSASNAARLGDYERWYQGLLKGILGDD